MSPSSPNLTEAHREAGRIAAEVRARARNFVKINGKLIDICEKVEEWTRELGGAPAFPCNISINEVAAHYTSPIDDKKVVPEKSVVKVDIGAHVDGYIADTAVTVCFNPEYDRLVKAAEGGLQAAIEVLRAGIRAYEVGAVIEKRIREWGFKPIWNLTGHMVSRYNVHAGETIPNVPSLMNRQKLAAGDVYAIEPFTTLPTAAGEIVNGEEGHIYLFLRKRPLRSNVAKEMLDHIFSSYRTLPFTDRWVFHRFPRDEDSTAFRLLLSAKCIQAYPVLVEKSKGPVAQAEHTVLIKENGCQVIA
jgi:methionyl aminopeptidase